MSNNENEIGLADASPKGKMEQLERVIPAKKDDDKRQGRVPWANETHQEEATFQVASIDNNKGREEIQPSNKDFASQSNWMNKYENKQSETFGKENKEPISQNKHNSNQEKVETDNWINRYENKTNNYHGGNFKQDDKQVLKGEQVEKVEGKKVSYNEDNNKAKGKSLFDIMAASANQTSEPIKIAQQKGQNVNFGEIVKKSIPESSVKIKSKPEQVTNQPKLVPKEIPVKPPPQNTGQTQSNDKPQQKSFVEMVRNTIKPTTPPPPAPKGPSK
jgi:hypothetical protein